MGGGNPESSRSILLAHTAGRVLVATAVCLLLLVLLGHSIKIDAFYWPYQKFTRNDGTMVGVLEQQGPFRLLTFYIGLASRDAAGGRIERLVAPKRLGQLAELPPAEKSENHYSAYFLQQMSGDGLEQRDYDTVLPDRIVERLRGEYRLKQYPRNVVGIVGEPGGGEVVLFTDSDRASIYALPQYVADEVLR